MSSVSRIMKPPRIAHLLMLAAAVPATALVAAGPAQAAGKKQRPIAVTGGVSDRTPTGVTVNGRVNPRGEATNVVVQYGKGNSLGSATPVQALPPGTKSVAIKVALANLSPVTKYSYRVVASSIDGRTVGRKRGFTTPKVPPSATLTAAPATVRAGQTVILSGTIGGTDAPGSRVTALQRPFPFTTPFAAFGNALVVKKDGAFSTYAQPQVTTHFVVQSTVGGRRTQSPIITVGVRQSVSLRAKRYKSGRLRFSGTVRPGGPAVITLRRLSSRGKRVTAARTTASGSPTGTFSFPARMTRRARYLVLVQPTNAAWVKTESSPKRVAASR